MHSQSHIDGILHTLFFFRVWKDMSLDNTISEYERAKLAVWDYPVSDKYTKIWKEMKNVHMPASLEEAVDLVQASPDPTLGFALIADATDVR